MKIQWNTWTVFGLFIISVTGTSAQQPIVPGTGIQLEEVGDDFEDPNWSYQYNLPKCFNDKDTALAKNAPGGVSANGRWFEGMKRGQPDVVRRVPPPAGGIPGSQGALLLCSLRTGGQYPSNTLQQEDFVASVFQRVGKIPVARQPSVVTRVWMPPFEEWENRVGQCHFAFRLALEKQPYGSWSQFSSHGTENEDDHFWPGIFVNLIRNPEAQSDGRPYAIGMWMKATSQGRQIKGPVSTQTGWWTMGMSLSGDGKVHYFAKPGVDDLTMDDLIGSDYPFGYRAVLFRNFFFNVCNGDNGRDWSTQFVIDDPAVFVSR